MSHPDPTWQMLTALAEELRSPECDPEVCEDSAGSKPILLVRHPGDRRSYALIHAERGALRLAGLHVNSRLVDHDYEYDQPDMVERLAAALHTLYQRYDAALHGGTA